MPREEQTPPRERALPSARLARSTVRFRYPIALVAILLAIVCTFPVYDLIRLHIKTDFFSLLPEDQPSIVTLFEVIETTGGFGELMVVVDSPDRQANVRFMEELHEQIRALDWVSYAEYGVDASFFERNAMLYVETADLETIEQRLRDRYEYEVGRLDPFFFDILDEGPPPIDFSDIEERYGRDRLFRPYNESEDEKTLIMAVYPLGISGEIRESRRYLDELAAATATIDAGILHPEMTVRIGGSFKDRIEEYDAIMNDLKFSGLVMTVLFVALLLLYFRHLVAVPLVFLAFGPPLLWTFALARVVVTELNFVTVFLVVILAGLGVDYTIHSLTRYQEERVRGRSMLDALSVVNATTARASLISALTTAAAFLTLASSRFLGFRQFGIIAGFGVCLAFLSAVVVLPALLAIAEEWGVLRVRQPTQVPPPVPRRGVGLVLATAAFAAAIGVVSVAGLEFETDFTNLQTRLPAESRSLKETIRTVLAGRLRPVVLRADNLEETREIEAILERQLAGDDPTPMITSVISVLDVLPLDQDARLEVIASIRRLLTDMAPFVDDQEAARVIEYQEMMPVAPLTVDDLDESLERRFFGVSSSGANLIYLLHDVDLRDTERAAFLVEDVQSIEGETKTWHGASDAVIVNDLLRVMKEDSALAIPLALLAAYLVLALDFRSLRTALIPLIPLAIGFAWMFAIMWLTGMKLNLYNMVMLPSMVGIGIDSGVHVYHRFLEGGDISFLEAMRSTNGALVVSALTTMIGFGSMSVSAHAGLASLGALALLGLSCALVAATTVFPLLLQRFPKAFA
jgi:predicted RND superfamily exporter protein